MEKTEEVNEKYMKEIYLNILKAIIIVLYFLILNLSYENVRNEYLDIGIKALTMIFLFISIYIFEIAYKKDDGKLAIQGIEVLILATYTLTTEHIINKFKFNFKSYSLVASYLLATYFILKCIIIYTKGKKEVAEGRSDIREIVKKNESVKKETTKKVNILKDGKVTQISKSNTSKENKTKTIYTKKKRKLNQIKDIKSEDNKTEQKGREKEKKEVTKND